MSTGNTKTLFIPIFAVVAGIALLAKTIPSHQVIDSPLQARIAIQKLQADRVEATLLSKNLTKLWNRKAVNIVLRSSERLDKTGIYAALKHEATCVKVRTPSYRAEVKNLI